ncbi:MAG: hypothetical protein AAFP70_08010, partial [Calditrichota bacterium]
LDDVDNLNKSAIALKNIEAKLEDRSRKLTDTEKLAILPVLSLISAQQVHLLYLPEFLIIHIATGGQGTIFAAVLKQKLREASKGLDKDLKFMNNALAAARKPEDVEILRQLQKELIKLDGIYKDIISRMPIYKGHYEE